MTLQETLVMAYLQKQWLKYPIQHTKLNIFWHHVLYNHWRNVISNNLLPRLSKSFKWTNDEQQVFYNELYRLFYEAHPDGPGVPAVETKTPPVPPFPLFFVPQPQQQQQPHHNLLFLYSCLARYLNRYHGTSILLRGNVVNQQEFRQHISTRSWFVRLPTSPTQYYRIYLPGSFTPPPSPLVYEVETSGYDKVVIPAVTNQDRFGWSRFLFQFMIACKFAITLWGNKPVDIDQFYDDVAFDNKLSTFKFVLGHSNDLWWLTVYCK